MKEETVVLVVGILAVIIGLVMIIAFVASLVRCRTSVEAVVRSVLVKTSTLRGSTVKRYTPEFSYIYGGHEYLQKADWDTSSESKYAVGQKVTLRIDPKHPECLRQGSNAGVLVFGLLLAIVGVVLIVFVAV